MEEWGNGWLGEWGDGERWMEREERRIDCWCDRQKIVIKLLIILHDTISNFDKSICLFATIDIYYYLVSLPKFHRNT